MKKFTLLFLILFLCTYSAFSWAPITSVPNNANINSISAASFGLLWVACDGGKVYKKNNGASQWQDRSGNLPSVTLYGIDGLDTLNCWVGTETGSIYRTTDGGNTWVLQIAIPGSFVNGIHMFDMNNGMFTADPTGSGQPYQNRYTTNGGTNWILSVGSPLGINEFGVINAWDWTDQNNVWIGSANLTPNATVSKIYKTSTGFNGTWSAVNVNGTGGTAGLYYQAIAFTDANNGMAGSNGSNVVKTTDGGASWQSAPNPPGVTTFAAITMGGAKDGLKGIHLCINETTGYRMFQTYNLGNTWIEELIPPQAQTTGIQDIDVVSWDLAYAGGDNGVVLVYIGPTGIVNQTGNSPTEYDLSQNYPNPFNPSTKISFSIQNAGFVKLNVYDNLGREVALLVNKELPAGTYEYSFEAKNLNSGIYFYKLQVNEYIESRRMVLLK